MDLRGVELAESYQRFYHLNCVWLRLNHTENIISFGFLHARFDVGYVS